MQFPALLTVVSLALLVAVIAVRLFKGRNGPQEWLFILSALVLAGTQIALLLMLRARDPQTVPGHFLRLAALLVFFPAFAAPFVAAFVRKEDRAANQP